MKLLILFSLLMSGHVFALCQDSKGNLAEISGLTLTVYNSDKEVIDTVDATKMVRIPNRTNYVDEDFNVLFAMVKVGKLHQGGRMEVKSRHINYNNKNYKCGK